MSSQPAPPIPVCATANRVHLLRFTSLRDHGRGVSVPCDEAGNVDMNSLTERLRLTYLGARALVGREYSFPTVQLTPFNPDCLEPTLQASDA
jgi:hypothetical protein